MPQSPPKRITRARAAAKASTDSSSITTSRTSSAASSSRAKKSTATATTASAAAKRKIRTEDNETDDEQDELGLDSPDPAVTMQKHARAIRGRPKKTLEPTNETAPPPTTVPAPASRTRGRPPSKKATTFSEAARESVRPPSSLSTATAPTASALARATKKQTAADETAFIIEVPTKKQAKRTRATSATADNGSTQSGVTNRISVRSASAVARSKTATSAKTDTTQKKRVTFEEPEKENIVPAASAVTGKTDRAIASKPNAEPTASAGLKAKPVRRAATASKSAGTAPSNAAASSRSRAAAGKDASDRPAAPLGPKKVTQVRLAREFDVESEDELGADIESHLKPLERSPTKPALAAGVTPAERNRTLVNMCPDEDLATRDINFNSISIPTPKCQGTLLVSPARRLAQVTVKEGLMMSPARRLEGLTPLDSALASKNISRDSGEKATANTSVLFSPAKRFPVMAKCQSIGEDETLRSPLKLSLLQTPAKRPSSPKKTAVLQQLFESKPAAVHPQGLNAGPLQAYRLALGGITESTEESADVGKKSDNNVADTKTISRSDVSIDNDKSNADIDDKNNSLAQMLHEMAHEAVTAIPESPSRRRDPRRISNATSVEERFSEKGSPGDPMDVDETIVDAATTLVAMSPPKLHSPSGAFGLRAEILDAYNDDDDMDTDANDTTRILFAHNKTAPATPDSIENCRCSKTPLTSSGHLSREMQSTAKYPKTGELGFTPLANQLYGWRIRSPVKEEAAPASAALVIEERDEKHSLTDTSNAVASLDVAGTLFEVSNEIKTPCQQSNAGQSTNEEEQADKATAEDEELAVEFDENLVVTEEDLDLAQEADDMSLMAPAEFEEMTQLPQSLDDTMSEASQEYGDENSIPIDPALLADGDGSTLVVPPITPQRVLTRTFHTVSKVPLRQADDSEPLSRRRSMSLARRAPIRRRSSPGRARNHAGNNSTSTLVGACQSTPNDNGRGLTRSATVISYSPTKRESRRESRRESLRESRRKSRRESLGGPALTLEDALFDSSESEVADMPDTPTPHISVTTASVPVTPTKNEGTWSTASTPARTPRHDLNTALLRGAVVFVDVHTTEGSDASAIFVELLAQMGAQCVERWSWNPSSPSSPSETDDGCSRVGITHVVFKDGSKRTLDKVRESNGLVQCVGVSWVLDCERSNQWQEEAPYYIDTALMPRGGGQRRKSMEPQALLNMNGLVVETPVKQISDPSNDMRKCRTAPVTPKNRRDSSLWMRTPDNECSAEKRRSYGAAGSNGQNETDADSYGEPGWDMMPLLTPVPKTPAPEAIARYAAKIAYTSPHGSDAGNSSYYDDDGDDTLHSMQFGQEPLVTRTCPPKQRATSYHGLGAGILTREKDEGVLMRLMAARRKSLQFAPKIGSPLSKTWN